MSSVLVALDSVALLLSGTAAYIYLVTNPVAPIEHYVSATVFVWLTTVMLLHFAGAYRFEAVTDVRGIADALSVSLGAAYLFFLAAAFSLHISETFSRAWVAAFLVLSTTAIFVLRILCGRIVKRLGHYELFRRNIAVAGDYDQCARLIQRVHNDKLQFVNIVGAYSDNTGSIKCENIGGITVAGNIDSLIAAARQEEIDDVVIALPWSDEERILDLVGKLRELPINLYLSADLIGYRLDFRQPPSHFTGVPVMEVIGKPLSGWDTAIKLSEDYFIGVLFLIIILPIFVLAAIAIKLDSPGPIFFKQKRLGFNNNVFEIYKFRTMHVAQGVAERTIQAQPGDPRVTRVGRFLRRSSIDELPQILNVLQGTMSLVGPRPHALDHNEEFGTKIRGYFARHRVKPGITGLAQVKGFRGPTNDIKRMEGRVKHDIYYTENWSLILDLKILFKTIKVCITGKNAF